VVAVEPRPQVVELTRLVAVVEPRPQVVELTRLVVAVEPRPLVVVTLIRSNNVTLVREAMTWEYVC